MLDRAQVAEKKRRLHVLVAGTPLEGFYPPEWVATCDECGDNEFCPFAFDAYNTSGDCLAEK